MYFSNTFKVKRASIKKYGAFDISLISDLPLFIDPFLLFTSENSAYRELHAKIIEYLKFLRIKSKNETLDQGLIRSLYSFKEVHQNWLGFSKSGNRGRALGAKFANDLNNNFHKIFSDFGAEKITEGTHLEKLCLVSEGVGKDGISDFTTNLIKKYLLEYTETFAKKYITENLRKKVHVSKVDFDYETETWLSGIYDLPWHNDDYILLTPVDILTKDETWINRKDLLQEFYVIKDSDTNDILRANINNYLKKILPENPKNTDYYLAARKAITEFPEIIDFFVKNKEKQGDLAKDRSYKKVVDTEQWYVQALDNFLDELSSFISTYPESKKNLPSYNEAYQKVIYLKEFIENNDGYRLFYTKDILRPFREEDVQLLMKLAWGDSRYDLNREVNNGRGPVDFTVSLGSKDKTVVEFKLARSTSFKKNLENQIKLYEKANKTMSSIKVVFYFSEAELIKIKACLKDLDLTDDSSIVLIDARNDNKISASKAG